MYGRVIMSRRKLKGVDQPPLADALGWYLHSLIDVENNRIGISRKEYSRIVKIIDDIAEAEIVKHEAA